MWATLVKWAQFNLNFLELFKNQNIGTIVSMIVQYSIVQYKTN